MTHRSVGISPAALRPTESRRYSTQAELLGLDTADCCLSWTGAIRVRCLAAKLQVMDNAQLLLLADAYKEQIYTKLLELVLSRLERLDPSVLAEKTFEEVLALVYMQGAAEALDAFDMTELLEANQLPTRLDA